MKKVNYLKKISVYALLTASVLFTGCKKDDDEAAPEEENEEEIITDVTLVFTNQSDSTVIKASAKDKDGPGVGELEVLDTITLKRNNTYTLTYEIFNKIENPAEDIGEEIAEKELEHQFFFEFSEVFTSPTGNGNIDKASDPINYDKDSNGNNLGLSTEWTTSSTSSKGGTFKVVLKHQPDVKTSTSGFTDGDTDFTLPFVLNID